MACKITNVDRFGNPLTADQMIKRFVKAVEKEGILQEYKKHSVFVPKSVARREKSKKHQRMLKKLERKRKRA